jgi:hypothetical protein
MPVAVAMQRIPRRKTGKRLQSATAHGSEELEIETQDMHVARPQHLKWNQKKVKWNFPWNSEFL